MRIEDASALEDTLTRLRQRYALHFTLPEGVKAGQERTILVTLAAAAARRYPDVELRFRKTYIAQDTNTSTPAEVTTTTSAAPSGATAVAEEAPAAVLKPRIRRVSDPGSGASAGPMLDKVKEEAPATAPKPAAPSANDPKEADKPKSGWPRVK